jgi:uncharacterized short protein YbdD (DUF466 family)
LPQTEQYSDWDRAEAEFDVFAAAKWFGHQADVWQGERRRARTKNAKQRAAFRRNLCLALAGTLTQCSSAWRRDFDLFYKAQTKTSRCAQLPAGTVSAYDKYVAQMRIALRWLPDDRIVKEFAELRRCLGDKTFLESAKKGPGRGVLRPYPSPQDMLLDMEIFDLYLNGVSLRKIAQWVKDNGLLSPGQTLSHVAVKKRIKALLQQEPFCYLLR